ncbi:hypothetical protein [Actinomadura sp. 3N407]|uniref:hypothetical protein n=1 Tax=Actinomadura sp. 3N407 TaxID=3457423 RepID=UPI003FCC8BA7
MGDMEKVVAECRAKHGVQEISDACARVIASLYHEGQRSLSYSLASTGAITDHPEQVWREMFGTLYSGASADEKLVMDMMGTYLTRAGQRRPVCGWSGLWL